ncbi:hypothetical protein LZ30DRAFT_778774 [Colletotrichum cereale]|nr:hypothetical protein LZ30DRAFT_778774 [Colletotrichum cereale]
MRWKNDKSSASAVIERLIESRLSDCPVTLQIQRELVIEDNKLEDTAASQEVSKELVEAKRRMSMEIGELRKDHGEALRTRDNELAEKPQKEKQEMEDRLRRAEKARTALTVNLQQLLRENTREFEERQRNIQDEVVKAEKLETPGQCFLCSQHSSRL